MMRIVNSLLCSIYGTAWFALHVQTNIYIGKKGSNHIKRGSTCAKRPTSAFDLFWRFRLLYLYIGSPKITVEKYLKQMGFDQNVHDWDRCVGFKSIKQREELVEDHCKTAELQYYTGKNIVTSTAADNIRE